jgi:chaperonin cofactor prefoldin
MLRINDELTETKKSLSYQIERLLEEQKERKTELAAISQKIESMINGNI